MELLLEDRIMVLHFMLQEVKLTMKSLLESFSRHMAVLICLMVDGNIARTNLRFCAASRNHQWKKRNVVFYYRHVCLPESDTEPFGKQAVSLIL